MRAFCQLLAELEGAMDRRERQAVLEAYFRCASRDDAAWALWFMAGRRRRRSVSLAFLRSCAAEVAGIPEWMVEESHAVVGDWSETLALLVPGGERPQPPQLSQMAERLQRLASLPADGQRALVLATWLELGPRERVVWNRMIGGSLRCGVDEGLLAGALGAVAGVAPAVIQHRMQQPWSGTSAAFSALLVGEGPSDRAARPYPFQWPAAVGESPGEHSEELGSGDDWLVEWWWCGLRVQLLRRAGQTVLCSGDGEVVGSSFPEVVAAGAMLPDGTVLDGDVLVWDSRDRWSADALGDRLPHRPPRSALLRRSPAVLMVYDLLEWEGHDWRLKPLRERRAQLERLLSDRSSREVGGGVGWVQPDLFSSSEAGASLAAVLRVSPALVLRRWEDLEALRRASRSQGARGVMWRHLGLDDGLSVASRPWRAWRVEPWICRAVLVGAEPGQGRPASLFAEYTFAVREGEGLIPVATISDGLGDAEVEAVHAFVLANTTAKFGPSRSVRPELVFELVFEGVSRSRRRRGGLVLRSARVKQWRREMRPEQADTLESLMRLAMNLERA